MQIPNAAADHPHPDHARKQALVQFHSFKQRLRPDLSVFQKTFHAVAQSSFQFTSSTPLAAVLSRFVFWTKSVRAPGAALAGICSVRWMIPSPAGCFAITATSPDPDTV